MEGSAVGSSGDGDDARSIDATLIRRLDRSVSGSVVTSSDPEYEDVRTIWNSRHQRRPSVIVRCGRTSDVATSIGFARDQGLEVAVRGGAHAIAGYASVEGGLVIDLSPMNAVAVDVDARRARVQGGVRVGDLDEATTRVGLAVPAGADPTTGMGGLTLGGGHGFISRSFGLTCDSVVSAEVVTAAGDVVIASADEYPDLLWGLRGGGGNLGVVTAFEFRLHRIPTMFGFGELCFDARSARVALQAFFEVSVDAPDPLHLFAYIQDGAPGMGLEPSAIGQPVLSVGWAYMGNPEHGLGLVERLRRTAKPLSEDIRPVTYRALQETDDTRILRPRRVDWRSAFMPAFSEAAIDAFVSRCAAGGPKGSTIAEIYALGGAIARIDPDATAYAHRTAPFEFGCLSRWDDEADDAEHVARTASAWEAVAGSSAIGAYGNSTGDEGHSRIHDIYPRGTFEHLSEIKARWDPNNVFHRNHNVAP